MLTEGLTYPVTVQDEALVKKICIGSLLLVSAPLIVPFLLYLGYCYRLIETISNEEDSLPSFSNISQLLYHGTKLAVIFILYGSGLAILIWTVLSLTGLLQILTAILSVIVYTLIVHLTPLMLYTYVQTDSIRSVFNFSTLLRKSISYKYTYITVLMSFVYPLIFGLVQGVFILTLVGVICIPAIIFWQTISQSYVLAQIQQLS